MTDEKQRLEALNILNSYIVQAPAGSGKTSLLTKRYLSLLANSVHEPEEIVCITFTKKAANEMKERILSALSDKSLELDSIVASVLKKDISNGWNILANPNRLKIMTIDALCASIAKKMPVTTEFGVLPKVTEAKDVYYRAVDKLLLAIDDSTINEDLTNLLIYFDNNVNVIKELLVNSLSKRQEWIEYLLELKYSSNQTELLNERLNSIITQELSAVKTNFVYFSDDIIQAINFASANLGTPLDLFELPDFTINNYKAWGIIINLMLTGTNTLRKTVTKAQGFTTKTKFKQDFIEFLAASSSNQTFVESLIKLKAIIKTQGVYSKDKLAIAKSIVNILPVLVAQLNLCFKEEGVVDFNQISIAANSALGDELSPTDLALAFDHKISHILVDEFQDTSISQYKLLKKLTYEWEVDSGKTLFLVGDPMQSIYKFRQAEVSLFLKIKHEGLNSIKLKYLSLESNFRSAPEIISWCNKVFTNSFPRLDNIETGAIKYSASTAIRNDINGAVHSYCLDCENYNEDEAFAIADIIKQERENNPDGSIAILVRSKKHLNDILPVLKAMNIDYTASDLDILADKSIIRDLIALVKSLLHLDDRLSWQALLRGPFCGLKLQDLYQISSSDYSIWQAINSDEILSNIENVSRNRISNIKSIFLNSIKSLGSTTIYQAVYDLYVNLGGIILANELKLKSEVEDFFEVLAAIDDEILLYDVNFLQTRLEQKFAKTEQHSNRVQIMSIHKSKGLEFDTVILPGLGKATVTNNSEFILWRDDLFVPIKSKLESECPLYDYLNLTVKEKNINEVTRLFYVACTRAKTKLYCFSYDAKSKAGTFQAALPANSATKIEVENSKAMNSKLNINPKLVRINYQMEFNSCDYHTDFSLDTVDSWFKKVGIFVHKILYEHVKFKTDITNYNYELAIDKLGMTHDKLAVAKNTVAKVLENISNCEHAKWILSKHQEDYAEWELNYISEMEGVKKAIIDRAFVDNGVFWIIDYKICHNQDLEVEVNRYKKQLKFYESLVRKIKGNINIKSALYFPLQSKLEHAL